MTSSEDPPDTPGCVAPNSRFETLKAIYDNEVTAHGLDEIANNLVEVDNPERLLESSRLRRQIEVQALIRR